MELCRKYLLYNKFLEMLSNKKEIQNFIDLGPVQNSNWLHRYLYRNKSHKYLIVFNKVRYVVVDIKIIV